ncbi:helicase-related protein [Pseudoxanthomonas sp. Soil82]|uniref:helicase-related protein n=1 Tax=Pseudoxanthomonas sp. Soil82 TaxID=3157341 RepID=UPI00338D4266
MSNLASQLFIVDNSDTDWKVRSYLSEWCELSERIDIATGYFEIGALLVLKEGWQKVDKIRLLMGNEVSMRTAQAFDKGLKRVAARLDGSLDAEKAKNDFLEGVPAIVEAIRSGKLECRVYRKDKFHAKTYITHGRSAVVGSFALVGSSNFTVPGLTDNIELNVQIRGADVGLLQEWYERHWEDAQDISADILKIIEKHAAQRSPYEIWVKALHELFHGEALTPDVWDRTQSKLFPELDRYQQDAYRNLLSIARTYGLAFLCDGVGLGKTFAGLMLIERFVVHEGKRVVLFAPKAAREDVWEVKVAKYLDDLNSGFVNFKSFNHTDLQRGGKIQKEIELTLRDADIVIIDEAHNFRNPGGRGTGRTQESRYRRLQRYVSSGSNRKQVFMLTATPVNNSIHDFRHMIEIASGEDAKYFQPTLGISSLRRHFIDLEKKLLGKGKEGDLFDIETAEDEDKAELALAMDRIFHALVVQRSRAYVRESQIQVAGDKALFPDRLPPVVAEYGLKKTYGKLLEELEKAFNKKSPLFVLGVYNPLAYYKGEKGETDADHLAEGRQKQVVTLIRTQFLKRFESSAAAFEMSSLRLLKKLFAWAEVHAEGAHDRKRLDRFKSKHAELLAYVETHQHDLFSDEADEDEVEPFLTEEMLADVEKLDPEEYEVGDLIDDCIDDMEQLAVFLGMVRDVTPKKDDKLQALIKLLRTDKVLKSQKLILFTEFADTARYLERELKAAGIEGIERIDGSSTQKRRSQVIRRFSPYYNDTSRAVLKSDGLEEIRVLIATDVLSEGLNLQDATRLINYDLHWNPVRLMQRIGRTDRRLDPKVEKAIIRDDPDQKAVRGTTQFWNFLPPEELNELLSLFSRVTQKTVMISRSFGIEGKQLLSPDDDFDPVKEMNERFDGVMSEVEKLRLEYDQLRDEHPELIEAATALPSKAFSGRKSVDGQARVFFCHRIPRPDPSLVEAEPGQPRWSLAAGYTVWTEVAVAPESSTNDVGAIAPHIRCEAEEKRATKLAKSRLIALREQVEKELVKHHLRPLQAPVGVSPSLMCWLEQVD